MEHNRDTCLTNPTSMPVKYPLWFKVARGTWIVLTLLTLSLVVDNTVDRYERLVNAVDLRTISALPISAELYSGYLVGLSWLVVGSYYIVATIIFFRRSEDWYSLFMAYTFISIGSIIPLSSYWTQSLDFTNPVIWTGLSTIIQYVAIATSMIFLYLFPNGKFVPGTTWLWSSVWLIVAILVVLAVDYPYLSPNLGSPLIPILILIWSISGIVAQTIRYRFYSTTLERQQIRWAGPGMIAPLLAPIIYILASDILASLTGPSVPNLLYQEIGPSFFVAAFYFRLGLSTILGLILVLFPLTFAISIFRYRIWDIDIVVRQILVYGIAVGITILAFLLIEFIIKSFVSTLTDTPQPEIITILATLISVALFFPIKNTLQNEVDRRFYPERFTVDQLMTNFREGLSQEVDLNTLNNRLVSVVERIFNPADLSVFILPLKKSGDKAHDTKTK